MRLEQLGDFFQSLKVRLFTRIMTVFSGKRKLIKITVEILRILKRLALPRVWHSENDLKKKYSGFFNNPEGETILLDLAEKFHLGEPIVNDPIQEGERNVILYIVSMSYKPIEEDEKSQS